MGKLSKLLMAVWLSTGLGWGWAQTPPAPAKKAKATPAKPHATPKAVASASPKLAQAQAPLAALGEDLLAVSAQVHTGDMVCEANTVKVSPMSNAQGYFELRMGKHHYRMAPVASLTGAVRLEDAVHGAVWIQLANKSMLMNQKVGRRMADDCQSPAQMVVAEAMAKMPPINILEPLNDNRASPAAELANK
jgi:hypothetical protein